jgi:hypothetical protein
MCISETQLGVLKEEAPTGKRVTGTNWPCLFLVFPYCDGSELLNSCKRSRIDWSLSACAVLGEASVLALIVTQWYNLVLGEEWLGMEKQCHLRTTFPLIFFKYIAIK